jgi:hypothetical protein
MELEILRMCGWLGLIDMLRSPASFAMLKKKKYLMLIQDFTKCFLFLSQPHNYPINAASVLI